MISTRLALPLGLLTFAAYALLVPWTTRVWLRTGDEPHYLVAAHSLAYDGDFDLRNNYDPDLYQNWYSTAEMGRQVRTRADGAQFLVHTYGLPLLIAPAYRLLGHAGVAYFLAALGALLAANVYLLGHQATGDWRAAALGWFVISFSPPLVWYVFLIYPEMAGALCVTAAARVLIGERRTNGAPTGLGRRALAGWLVFGLALAALPWLSARFIPAMLALAALAAWRLPLAPAAAPHPGPLGPGPRGAQGQVWRDRRPEGEQSRLPAGIGPLVGLALASTGWAAFTIFNAALYQNPTPTASYAGAIDTPTASWYALLQFGRGLMGWLMDQQRGLLVSAPVYFVALIGLGQWLRQRAWGAVVVAAAFLAAWTSLSLLGGFWVGVEPAARYLVHVLPLLGAALAYGWHHRRGPWLSLLTAGGTATGLAIGLAIFRQPVLAQTESLIGKKAPALAPYLPALGRNIYLTPAVAGTIATPAGDGTLLAPAGGGGMLFRQDAIPDFSFGWYQVRLQLAAKGAPPDEPVARVLVQAGDNTRLLQAILKGSDFPADGSLSAFTFPVHNPVYNQWEQPGGMWVFSTGQAELRLGQVVILPDTYHSLVLPGLWLAGLALLGIAMGRQYNAQAPEQPEPAWFGSRALRAGLAGAALVALAWSLQPLPRTYEVEDLRHFIGALEQDASAARRQVILARPELAESAGVLASTGAQFYPPGRHVWRLRLKAGEAPPEAVIATARIYGARRPLPRDTLEIVSAAVPADGQFHLVEIEFDNPLEQALVFELAYTAATMVATDRFEVTAVR